MELLKKIMSRNVHLGGIYTEMIGHALRIGEIVKGDHVSWKLEKDIQRS